jgi:hypothetical protein
MRRRRTFALGGIFLALLAMTSVASAEGGTGPPTAYVSCGWPPTSSYGISSQGSIKYRIHPNRCFYSDDGSTAHLLNLVGIKWVNWGSNEAHAKAKLVDNHDQDENGFQRHRVRVIVSGLRPAVGHEGLRKLYYTRIRLVISGGQSFAETLYRPGQGVVRGP